MLSEPKVSITTSSAGSIPRATEHKVLMVGQMTSDGTATAGELNESLALNNEAALFGTRSMLTEMIQNFRKVNKETRLDVIPLADDSTEEAVAATSTITFEGTASAAGTFTLSVGSKNEHTYTLAIANEDTHLNAADALKALIDADTTAQFTAASTTGVVTLTMANKGPEGNLTGILISGSTAGLTATITTFANGATNPALTSAFDVVADEVYQTVIAPYSYEISFLTDFLSDRWNVENNELSGVGIMCTTDSLADLKAAVASINEQTFVLVGNKEVAETTYYGGAILEYPANIAAQTGAVRSLRLTSSAKISDYVVSSGSALDKIGGPALSTLPYFNTPMPYLPLVPTGKGFTMAEAAELEDAYVSVIDNNRAGNSIILGPMVTTYATDSAGNTDTVFKYLNSVDATMIAASFMFNSLKQDYAQSRLTDGDLIDGRAIANTGKITASFVKYFNELSGEDYVIAQAGEDALQYFKTNLTVTVDTEAGQVTATMILPIVSQVREFVVPVSITFSVLGA